MSETAVMEEPIIEPTIQAPPAPPALTQEQESERPIPVRKQRRFVASFRFNGFRYLTLTLTLLSAWGLVEASAWPGLETHLSTFLLVLAGGMLAAAAKTGLDIMSWAERNRQAIHSERVRSVQRVFQRACTIREQALIDWRRIHTVLVDNLSGRAQQIRLFHDHDETDRQGEKLMGKALTEETWIREDGVDAVRRFKQGIVTLDYHALATEAEFLEAFNGLMDRLRRDLALAAIGIPLE